MYYYPKDEEGWQKDLIKQLAKKHKLTTGVVRQMVYYPFLYLRRSIQSEDKEEHIRIKHLGVFTPKASYGKPEVMKKRAEVLLDNSDILWNKIVNKSSPTGTFTSKEAFETYIKQVVKYRRKPILNRYLREAEQYL